MNSGLWDMILKKVVFACAGIVVLLVLIPFPARAGDYHVKGKNLVCSDCHTLHFSEDGKVPDTPPWAWGTTAQEHLLKDVTSQMCLMCHDGDHPLAPDVLHSTPRINPAGCFGSDPNNGHTLESTQPPPGYKGTWDKPLTCTLCHDPHGNIYYRNLRQKPGAVSLKLPITYFPSPSSQDEGAVQQMSQDPSVHYNADNITYHQESLSDWCAGCHSNYNHGEGDEAPWRLHPAKAVDMSESEHVDLDFWASDLDFRPPAVRPLIDDPDNHEHDRPFCGSCHKAHGSSHRYGLLVDDPGTSQQEGGKYVRDTCQACHNIGKGYYESSPHGDQNHGVYHSDTNGFAKGECEHCHRQHGACGEGGYNYNLFSENTNSFCLTAGCHLEPPFGMNNLPQGEAARMPEGMDYQGYFEVNEGGQKIFGLEYRVRWTGADAYQDTHGFCTNCHTPHGTGSPFDMLKGTYVGMVNSDNYTEDPNNYQLCFSCHNNEKGPQGMQPEKIWTDEEGARFIADYYNQSINNDGFSGHQIRKSSRSASSWPSYIKGGEKLACSNCHNPHGSRGYNNEGRPNKYLLSDERRGWSGLDTLDDPNSSRRFCFGCHVPSDVEPADWGNPPVEGIIMANIADYSSSISENVHHPSAGSCDGCHADQGIMANQPDNTRFYTGPHAYHTDGDSLWSEWQTKGRNSQYNFACEMCHAKLNTGTGKAVHVNGRALLADDENASSSQYVEVCFHDDMPDWTTQTLHQQNYRYRSLYRNPYNGEVVTPAYISTDYEGSRADSVDEEGPITWSDQRGGTIDSCQNIWCHSNANPLSLHDNIDDPGYRENIYQSHGSSFSLTWDDHGGDRCDNCHGFTNPLGQPEEEKWYLSSVHRNHIGSEGKEKILCGQCHAFTCKANANTIRDDVLQNAQGDGYFYHVNGEKDVVFSDDINPGGSYDDETHTCSNLYCHFGEEVSWNSVATQGCAACHGVYADGHDPHELCPAGFVHLAADWGPHLQCNDCHTGPYYIKGEIDAVSSTDDKLVAKGEQNWTDNMWKGSTLIISAPSSSAPVTYIVTGNTSNTLFFQNLPGGESLTEPPIGTYSIVSPGGVTHCDGQITYTDGVGSLAETTVCDKCHSPGGDYDGVNDPVIGAKANWKAGIYTDYGEPGDIYKKLKGGKERWCVGCHDKAPAYSRSAESDEAGVWAPNVAGDERASTLYGKGYGYFKTGHGLDRNENYPASEDPGAGSLCTDCHDIDLPHIDHEHRTYSAAENNYRLGYRLQEVRLEGIDKPVEPMDIPRTWYDGVPDNVRNETPLRDWQDFALCFKCHAGDARNTRYTILGDGGRVGGDLDPQYCQDPIQTNFVDSDFYYCQDKRYYGKSCPTDKGACYQANLHARHLEGRFRGKNLDWASSWGNKADSSLSCPACHNVHGSPSPRMMRHGELISTPIIENGELTQNDKVPAINFYYFSQFDNFPRPPKDERLIDTMGGEIFSQHKAGPGKVGVNKICNTCHRAWCWYFRLPDIDPQILSVKALNSPSGVSGVNAGDKVIITLNNDTNGKEKVLSGQDVKAYFMVYQDANQKEMSQRNWGIFDEDAVTWTSDGGHSDDTLIITLGSDATISTGDELEVISKDLRDPNTGRSFMGASKVITGTFDCSLEGAYARAGDELQVIFKFLGSTAGNYIDTNNVDHELKLNHSHSWGEIGSLWSDSTNGDKDILTITLIAGSTIGIGDIITLGGIITDAAGNQILGSTILQGSFDPPTWHKPELIHDFSAQGPPGCEAIKSIDDNLATYWHPAGREGFIVYDLLVEYQISRIRIYSNDYPGEDQKALLKIWVSSDPSFSYSSDAQSINPLVVSEWEVLIETGWHESPVFDTPKNGRYIKIEGNKIGAGPLILLFSEVEFEGVGAPLPPS